MLKVLVYDKVFILCVLLDIALIMGTHYLMTKYDICKKDIGLCGRYITGILSIGIPFTGWCLIYEHIEALIIFWLLSAVAGASTVVFYLIDGMREKAAAEKDLQTLGLAVTEN